MNKIIDKKTAVHYLWGDKCDSWVLANTPGLSVKHERMPESSKEKLHYHTIAQQFFFILKGSAAFYYDNKKEIINEQQGLLVNPMTQHYIANETTEELEFLVISQPETSNDRINIGK